ncbi:MAG: response regulator [Anaerolineae bacterium]
MTNPLILLIEDDPALGKIFSLALQGKGFTTEWVTDGAAALLRLAEITPNLVILDLHLPNVAGTSILAQIRADARLANTPVILTTADERLAQTLEEQANLVLLKPISPEQLSMLAARLVKRT